jgi:hypothetical protein
MNFLGFLKTVSKGVLWATGILQVIPRNKVTLAAADWVMRIQVALTTAELTTEALGIAQGGAAKLQAVASQAAVWIKASELVAGRDIADEDLFAEGVQDVVDGLLKVQKSLKN